MVRSPNDNVYGLGEEDYGYRKRRYGLKGRKRWFLFGEIGYGLSWYASEGVANESLGL